MFFLLWSVDTNGVFSCRLVDGRSFGRRRRTLYGTGVLLPFILTRSSDGGVWACRVLVSEPIIYLYLSYLGGHCCNAACLLYNIFCGVGGAGRQTSTTVTPSYFAPRVCLFGSLYGGGIRAVNMVVACTSRRAGAVSGAGRTSAACSAMGSGERLRLFVRW